MLFKIGNKTKSAWRITIPEKFGITPYTINTSPVVLGSSMQCDVVIQDPSLLESHIQFVLLKDGKYLEIYDLSGSHHKTLLNGEPINGKKRVEAQKGKNFTLKAGDVHLSLSYSLVTDEIPIKKEYVVREKDIEWFYIHEGVEYGPVKLQELMKAARTGILLPLDDAWHSGLKSRIKAFEVPDLFAQKSHTPHISDAVDSNKHICPYCWHSFKTEELFFIARHPALMGDPVLGYDEQQRFLPRYIKPFRRALDSRGEICTDMACPRCHLRIPTPFLDSNPLFFSIIGSPGAGKSYYLATSTWRLRKILPEYFGLNFEDIDNMTNQWINSYEEKLFLPARGVDYNSIEKTQIESSHTAREVKINAISMFLPLPAIFSLLSNSNYHRLDAIQNSIAFYDNAGEHFQTGQDKIQKPGSLHILRANGLLFLFDPTADPRFTNIINSSLRTKLVETVYQQQKILIEVIDRIRKHTGLNVKAKFNKPIVIGVSKADLLMDYFRREGINIKTLPYKFIKPSVGALNMSQIKEVSASIRELFLRLSPEFVNTVESFADNVIYLPVSAIGHQPDAKGVHPADINPLWVEVPFLYILSKMGYIPYINQ
ncbi:MAG: FHA domain-containing protein [Desulfamplus sp.]|nr:FHA domain-containing protein [Desulfamplus sp.]